MISPAVRRHIAGAIPQISGNLSFLVRTAPVLLFLWQFAPLTSADGGPVVWALTVIGVAFGIVASAPTRLFAFEADGKLYRALGVRQLRSVVTNGDRMVRVMNAVSPGSFVRLGRATLAARRAYHRTLERLHWAILFGTVPALGWAAYTGRTGYASLFTALIVFGDLYPIMLQRYSLAALNRIESRVRSGRPGD